jgi:hypothetical protein
MKRVSVSLVLATAISVSLAFVARPVAAAGASPQVGGFSRIVIPVMANTPGMFNSLFRTKVAILNATQLNYSIQVILYGGSGQVNIANIAMAPGQLRNYENFLADVFSFTGAGTVIFDANGLGRDFLVTAEVFNDLGAGRYKTVVAPGPILENALPEFDSYSLGITVDGKTRTNIGFFNDSPDSQTITADLFDASGTKVTSIPTTLSGKSWAQVGIGTNVSNGFIRWKVQASAYCYAVVVDNLSQDGTFIPAADYIP